jgi:hypothetical protein
VGSDDHFEATAALKDQQEIKSSGGILGLWFLKKENLLDTLVNGTAPARGGRGRRGEGGGDAPAAPGGRRGGQ